MMPTYTQFRIQQLRMANTQKIMEGVLALLAGIFIVALLPSLLLEYVYADQVLTEAPPVLKYLPLVVFSAGILYVIYVAVNVLTRSKKIAQLERELALSSDDAAMIDSSSDEQELKELEALVDEALASQNKKSTKTSKPAAKKSGSKKKSQKK